MGVEISVKQGGLQLFANMMRIFSFDGLAGRIEYIFVYTTSVLIFGTLTHLPKDFVIQGYSSLVFFASLFLFFSSMVLQAAVTCRRFSDLRGNEIFLILWICSIFLGAFVSSIAVTPASMLYAVITFLTYLCPAYLVMFSIALAILPGGNFNRV